MVRMEMILDQEAPLLPAGAGGVQHTGVSRHVADCCGAEVVCSKRKITTKAIQSFHNGK